MYLFLGAFTGLDPATPVLTDTQTILESSFEGDTLEVSVGQLIINGITKGKTAKVFEGDTVQLLLLSSPSASGTSVISYLTQDNKRVGYALASTKAVENNIYDIRYNQLFAFDSIEPYTPPLNRTIQKLNLQGELEKTLDLNSNQVLSDEFNLLAVADYHRNEVLLIDTDSFTIAKRLTDGSGPTEIVHYYSPLNSERTFTVVAYSKSNEVVIYDQSFKKLNAYANLGASYLSLLGNKLYVGHLNTKVVNTYTINAVGTLTKTADLSFTEIVTGMFVYENEMYFCAGPTVVNSLDEIKFDLPSSVRSVSAQYGTPNIYFTFGNSKVVAQANMLTNTVQERVLNDALFLSTLYTRTDGTLFIFDTEGRKGYTGTFNNLTSIDISYASYGAVLTDALYLVNLYSDLPRKITIDRLEYEIESTLFVDNEDLIPGSTLNTGIVKITEANRPVNVQVVSSVPVTINKNNNIENDTNFYAVKNDTLVLTLPITFETPDPTVLGYLIGDTYIDTLSTIFNVDLIPDNFYFVPQFNVPTNAHVFSEELILAGLDEPIELSCDAILIVDGVEVSSPHTVSNGNVIQLRGSSSDINGYTTDVTLRINDLFSTVFSFITVSVDEPVNSPAIYFGETFDHPLKKKILSNTIELVGDFPPTVIRIPTFYNARLIINDIDVGTTATVNVGDLVQISLVTTYNRDAPHIIPITMPFGTAYWIAWTAGDTMPGPFDFGVVNDLSIKTFVSSSIVNLTGISSNVEINVRVPYGCVLFVDGVEYKSGVLDYRGVPLYDHAHRIKLSPTSDLQLKGYPRTEHGTENKVPIYIGSRKGYWTLKTYDVFDLLHSSLGVSEKIACGDIVETYSTDTYMMPVNTQVEVYSTQSLVVPNRNIVVENSALIVAATREVIIAPTLTEVDYLPTWEYLKSSILYQVSRETYTIGSVSNFAHPSNITVQYSNSPLVFKFEPTWDTYKDVLIKFTQSADFKTETNSQHSFKQPTTYETTTDTYVYFDRAEVEKLEAILFGSNYIEFFRKEFATIRESTWFVRLPYTDKATTYVATSFYEFQYPFYVYPEAKRPEFSEKYYVSSTERILFEPKYEQLFGTKRIEFLPEYEANVGHNVLEVFPIIQASTTSETLEFKPPINGHTSNPYYLFKFGNAVNSANFYTVDKNKLFINVGSTQTIFKPNEAEVFSTYDPISFTSQVFEDTTATDIFYIDEVLYKEDETQFVRTPMDGTTHPGYFETYNDAVDNAHLWGKIDGEYYIGSVSGKGFVWVIPIPCENMCNPNDCPPHGYIHGG